MLNRGGFPEPESLSPHLNVSDVTGWDKPFRTFSDTEDMLDFKKEEADSSPFRKMPFAKDATLTSNGLLVFNKCYGSDQTKQINAYLQTIHPSLILTRTSFMKGKGKTRVDYAIIVIKQSTSSNTAPAPNLSDAIAPILRRHFFSPLPPEKEKLLFAHLEKKQVQTQHSSVEHHGFFSAAASQSNNPTPSFQMKCQL